MKSFYVYPSDGSAPHLVHADTYDLDNGWITFFGSGVALDRFRVYTVQRVRNLSDQPCLTTAEVLDDAC